MKDQLVFLCTAHFPSSPFYLKIQISQHSIGAHLRGHMEEDESEESIENQL